MASGQGGGATSDTGQLAGDTALGDAPERGLGSSVCVCVGGASCKRRSRKPWAQGWAGKGSQGGCRWGPEFRVPDQCPKSIGADP